MRILIVTKDSTEIEEALRISAQITQQADKRDIQLAIVAYLKRSKSSETKAFLSNIEQKISDHDLDAEVHIGLNLTDIIREVKKEKYDLVMMVESCRQGVDSGLRSSLPLQIEKNVPSSVLILQGSCAPIDRVLLCDSGAESFQSVMDFTTRLLSLLPGDHDITVLHVMSQISAGPGVSGKQLRAEADELIEKQTPEGRLLQHDLNELDQPGLHSIPKVRHGLVVEEIIAETNSGDYDLVVIGAHQQEGWQRFLLENIAQKIIKKIGRSVLVVKT
jgi:nucleotide-binding universal stress UspA family protein